MSENCEIMVRFIEECWNRRSRTVCFEMLSPAYENYMTGADKPTVGPAAYQQLVDAFVQAFPDARLQIDDVFGEGGQVCLCWTARGTHRGAFKGIAPTHLPVSVKGVCVARIVDGRIVRIVSMFDNDSLTKQIGTGCEKEAGSWRRTSVA